VPPPLLEPPPPLPGPPGRVLIPESGAPVLGVVALWGAVGVPVVVAFVSVTVVVGCTVVVEASVELPELLEPQAPSSSPATTPAIAAKRLIATMIP
jgi:hypothetical protein